MAVKRAKMATRRKRKPTKTQEMALFKIERIEGKSEIRKPKTNLSPKLAKKANKPIDLGYFSHRIKSNFPKNIPKIIQRAVAAETRGDIRTARKIVESRLDELFEANLTPTTQKELTIIGEMHQHYSEPPKQIKRPLTRNRPNQRIPKATIAKKAFDQHAGIRGLIGSSFVHYLEYNPDTKIVTVRLGASNYHTQSQVPEKVFLDWKAGKASCITSDTSSLKRWKVGKTPSLGAFFNQHIKGKYNLVRGLA